MDLISRKAAIEALGEEPLRWNNTITEGQEWNDWKYHVNAVKSVPSVQAVPLEPLAEWLGEYAVPPVSECLLTVEARTAAWKAALNKFVEEQDAAD